VLGRRGGGEAATSIAASLVLVSVVELRSHPVSSRFSGLLIRSQFAAGLSLQPNDGS